MKALAIKQYCTPGEYEILNLPRPEVTDERAKTSEDGDDTALGDLVIRVHAASINPVDVKLASGAAKMIWPHS